MAGFADLLGYADAPIYKALSPYSNTAMGFGAGLLSGKNWQEGLAKGGQGAMQGNQMDMVLQDERTKQEELRKRVTDTAAWARSQFPELANAPDDVVAQMAPGLWEKQYGGGSSNTFADNAATRQTLGQQYGLTGDDLTRYVLTGEMPGSNQSTRAGLGQPITVRNKSTGQVSAAMPMSDGSYWDPFNQTAFGPEWEFDPAWVAAQRAQGTQLGKEVGGAQFDLPGAELTMNQTLRVINAIRAEEKGMDEQFGNIVGVPQQLTPAWPGSDKAKFQVAVSQGTDRAFLEAREVLRGGGQITDFESRKAENAITNMQLAMEKGDKKQFLAALDEFEKAVKDGYAKLQAQASVLPSVGGGSAPAGGVLTYNPATGELE